MDYDFPEIDAQVSPNQPESLASSTERVSRAEQDALLHTCDVCQPLKNFTTAEHLRQHQLSHRTLDLKCSVQGCTKSFHEEALLLRHEQQHTIESRPSSKADTNASALSSAYPLIAKGIFSNEHQTTKESTEPDRHALDQKMNRSNARVIESTYIPSWFAETITQQLTCLLKPTRKSHLRIIEQPDDFFDFRQRTRWLYHKTAAKLTNLLINSFMEGGSMTTVVEPQFLGKIILGLSDDIAREVILATIPPDLLFDNSLSEFKGNVIPGMPTSEYDESELEMWRSLLPVSWDGHYADLSLLKQSQFREPSLREREQLAERWNEFLQRRKDIFKDLKQQIHSITYACHAWLFSIYTEGKVKQYLQTSRSQKEAPDYSLNISRRALDFWEELETKSKSPNTQAASRYVDATAVYDSSLGWKPPKTTPTMSTLKALPGTRGHVTDQLNQAGDEYIPRETDSFGEEKVMANGQLLGGRSYRCRTFYLVHRGDKLFMLATECARVLGYRDSYLLFNKNRSLFKIIASQSEKDDLVQQEILPFSYRSRQIAFVTARSMFRQFGSRVIENGHRVRDDYWETKARKQGFTTADLAGEKRPGAAMARALAVDQAPIDNLAIWLPSTVAPPTSIQKPSIASLVAGFSTHNSSHLAAAHSPVVFPAASKPHVGPETPSKPGMSRAVSIRSPWNPFNLIRLAKENDPTALLGNLVCVTGDWELAQAERCRDYVGREWSREGEQILSVLEEIVEEGTQPSPSMKSQTDDKRLIRQLHQLPGAIHDPAHAIRMTVMLSDGQDTAISFEGDESEVALVVSLFAWLTAAFDDLNKDIPQISCVDLEVEGGHLDIKVHRHTNDKATCWLPMLQNACIAYGFPICDRESQRGVRMSIEMAATLIGATRLTVFDGGLVMLGYAGMLLPVKIVADTVQWHFVPSESVEEPMTYQHGVVACPNRLMITDLAAFEQVCYIGWHPEARSRIAHGSGRVEYSKILKSGLGDPSSRLRLRNMTVGFQQIATLEVGVDLVPYQSPRFYQMKRRRYESILRQLDRSRVLIYDVNTDRAWLLSAADVALHMIQYRLWHCPIPFEGGDITTLELMGTSLETLRRSATIELEKGYSIQEMVINTSESFEHLQSELRTQSTREIMLSLPGRNSLLGFEYTALAEERSDFELRDAVFKGLFMKGPTWVDLIQADKPLVLFGNNFGELIALEEASQRNTCDLWQRVPSGASLMTVTGEVLRQMYDEEPGRKEGESTNPCLTSQKLEWHQGSARLFECCTTPLHSCSCQRTQSLAVRKPLSSAKIVPPAEYPTTGAVIFGFADRVKRPALVTISPRINLPDCPSERQLSKRPMTSFFNRSRTAPSHVEQAVRSDSAIVMEGIETERLR